MLTVPIGLVCHSTGLSSLSVCCALPALHSPLLSAAVCNMLWAIHNRHDRHTCKCKWGLCIELKLYAIVECATQQLMWWWVEILQFSYAQLFDVSKASENASHASCEGCSNKGLGSACAQGWILWVYEEWVGMDASICNGFCEIGIECMECLQMVIFVRRLILCILFSLHSWFLYLMNYQIHRWCICTPALWTRSPFRLASGFKESHWDSLKSMRSWPQNFKNLTCPRFFISISVGFSLPSTKYSATSPFSSTWQI